jgi:acetolactate synthase-1/2/3 large subunit
MSKTIGLSDYVIERLNLAGVDHFFIVVGGNVMYLNESIRKSGIPYTSFHHEQSATMAAESYARQSGKIACVVVTSGPGASNIVTGVAGAYYDSVPIIVLCGNPKSSELRSPEMPEGVRQVGTFELPIDQICIPISKYTRTISSSRNLDEILNTAIAHCTSGRPGPVVLVFPLDIQNLQLINNSKTGKHLKPILNNSNVPETCVFWSKLVSAIATSSRPIVLVGHGVRVSGEAERLLEILHGMNLPIVTTQLAKDFIPYENELFVGHVGVRGDRPGNISIHRADLILCIGTSLHQQNIGYESNLFAPNAKKFIVELNGSVSGKKLQIQASYIDSEIQYFVGRLQEELQGYVNLNSNWNNSLMSLKLEFDITKENHDFSTARLNLYQFVEKLSNLLIGSETIITDAGLCFYIMGQAFKLKKGQRYIVSGGLGCMGYALPAAIGASINGSNPVIAVTGDGSLQFNLQELATLSLIDANITIFVINNSGYTSIRNTQNSFFQGKLIGCSESTGVAMPTWKLIAQSYNIEYIDIKNLTELINFIPTIVSNKKPQLVEVLCQIDQIVMPRAENYLDETGNVRSKPLDEMIPKKSSTTTDNALILN